MSRVKPKLTALLTDAKGEPLPTVTDPKTRRKIAITAPGAGYRIRFSVAPIGRGGKQPECHLFAQFDAGDWEFAGYCEDTNENDIETLWGEGNTERQLMFCSTSPAAEPAVGPSRAASSLAKLQHIGSIQLKLQRCTKRCVTRSAAEHRATYDDVSASIQPLVLPPDKTFHEHSALSTGLGPARECACSSWATVTSHHMHVSGGAHCTLYYDTAASLLLKGVLKESDAAHRELLGASGVALHAGTGSAPNAVKREDATGFRSAGSKRSRGGVKIEADDDDDALPLRAAKRPRASASAMASASASASVSGENGGPLDGGDRVGSGEAVDLTGPAARELVRAQRRRNASFEVHCDLTADDKTVWTEMHVAEVRQQQRDAEALALD